MVSDETRAEMCAELYEAVFAGDLVKARAVLDEAQRCGAESEAIRRAKLRARPELRPDLTAPVVETFPVAGHLPGSFIGNPRIADSGGQAGAERTDGAA